MKSSQRRFLVNICLSLSLALMIGLGSNIANAKGGAKSLDSAVASVQEKTSGRVLRASQKGSHYVIKVLMPSGVVKTFRIRAQGN